MFVEVFLCVTNLVHNSKIQQIKDIIVQRIKICTKSWNLEVLGFDEGLGLLELWRERQLEPNHNPMYS